jgi:hypothetical protein
MAITACCGASPCLCTRSRLAAPTILPQPQAQHLWEPCRCLLFGQQGGRSPGAASSPPCRRRCGRRPQYAEPPPSAQRQQRDPASYSSMDELRAELERGGSASSMGTITGLINWLGTAANTARSAATPLQVWHCCVRCQAVSLPSDLQHVMEGPFKGGASCANHKSCESSQAAYQRLITGYLPRGDRTSASSLDTLDDADVSLGGTDRMQVLPALLAPPLRCLAVACRVVSMTPTCPHSSLPSWLPASSCTCPQLDPTAVAELQAVLLGSRAATVKLIRRCPQLLQMERQELIMRLVGLKVRGMGAGWRRGLAAECLQATAAAAAQRSLGFCNTCCGQPMAQQHRARLAHRPGLRRRPASPHPAGAVPGV